jgi:hypothetical protein
LRAAREDERKKGVIARAEVGIHHIIMDGTGYDESIQQLFVRKPADEQWIEIKPLPLSEKDHQHYPSRLLQL